MEAGRVVELSAASLNLIITASTASQATLKHGQRVDQMSRVAFSYFIFAFQAFFFLLR